MRSLSSLFILVTACFAAAAQTPAPSKTPSLDKAKIEAYIRQVELLPEGLKVKVGDGTPSVYANFLDVPVEVETPNGIYAIHYFVSKDGNLLVKGNLFDMRTAPFEAERKQLKTDMQPSFGTPGAPVVVVVFSDFQCPKCKEEASIIRDNLRKTFEKDVRVYFKDFPLETLHPWSKQAAIAGRCVFRQQPAAFWDYHDWIYEHQSEINPDNLKAKVEGWAETQKLDSAKLGECIATKATEKEVDRSVAEGRMLGVSGTPTLFINGRPITGALPWPNLEQLIKMEIEYAKKAGAGEKCCEVSLPGLAK
jgi:protein-disulfide isomerase